MAGYVKRSLDELNDAVEADDCDALTLFDDMTGAGEAACGELLETGSVTLDYNGRRFVVALSITEEE